MNRLVVSAQGVVRETLEGVVMLVASAVLFYVSYWLISHVEAKRWMDFLKQQARRGLELGGQGTLALEQVEDGPAGGRQRIERGPHGGRL